MASTLAFAGIQFPGRQGVAEIALELERQSKARKDYLVKSSGLSFKVIDNQFLLQLTVNGEAQLYPVTHRAISQLSAWAGLRMNDKFFRWLSCGSTADKRASAADDPSKNWPLLAQILTQFVQSTGDTKLVRLMNSADGTTYVRAILSNAYKIMDSSSLFYAVVEQLKAAKAELWHARLSEDRFYGYAVAPGITAKVNTERSFSTPAGEARWYGKDGDVVNAALAFGNSETGEGGLFLRHAILRKVCVNYCVWDNVLAMTHLGKRQPIEALLTQATKDKAADLVFAKIKDLTMNAFDPKVFETFVAKLNGATQDVVEDPEEAAEALRVTYNLTEAKKQAILASLSLEGDRTRYGLMNAVTAIAHRTERDPDAGFELERLGAALIDRPLRALYNVAKYKTETAKIVLAPAAMAAELAE